MVGDPQQILVPAIIHCVPERPTRRCTSATAARKFGPSRSCRRRFSSASFFLLFERGMGLTDGRALLGQDVTLVTECILPRTQCCGGLGETVELFAGCVPPAHASMAAISSARSDQ